MLLTVEDRLCYIARNAEQRLEPSLTLAPTTNHWPLLRRAGGHLFPCRLGLAQRGHELVMGHRMRKHRKIVFDRAALRLFTNRCRTIFDRDHVVSQFISC